MPSLRRLVLHFANGQTTLELLRSAHIPGDLRSADEILMEGPLPDGLATAKDVLFRAEWLDARLAIPKMDYLVGHARIERSIRQAAREDEVVVWSEEDVFCQVNLAWLLAKLADTGAPVSLICPPEVRLGRLDENRVHKLFEQRAPLAPERAQLAPRVWRALSAPDPREVERLLPELDTPWPAMRSALALHLARFPSTRDGLGRLERAILQSLESAPGSFADVVPAALAREDVEAYGIGDVQVHGILRALADEPRPLVGVDDPRAMDDPVSGGVWSVTADGRAVLRGEADAVALRGIDTWRGGVQLHGMDVWRWDEEASRLRPPAALPA